MKLQNLKYLFLVVTIFFLTSCGEKDDDPQPTTNPDDITAGANGVLIALRSHISTVGTVNIAIDIDAATGTFFNGSSQTLIDAGEIKMNGQNLPKVLSSNSYSLTPANLSGNISWAVSGSGDVPAFSYDTNESLPTTPKPTNLPTTLDKSQDLVINLQSAVSADLLYVAMGGVGGAQDQVYITFDSGSKQLTIPKSELSKINDAQGWAISIGAQNHSSLKKDGKTYVFVNTSLHQQIKQ